MSYIKHNEIGPDRIQSRSKWKEINGEQKRRGLIDFSFFFAVVITITDCICFHVWMSDHRNILKCLSLCVGSKCNKLFFSPSFSACVTPWCQTHIAFLFSLTVFSLPITYMALNVKVTMSAEHERQLSFSVCPCTPLFLSSPAVFEVNVQHPAVLEPFSSHQGGSLSLGNYQINVKAILIQQLSL